MAGRHCKHGDDLKKDHKRRPIMAVKQGPEIEPNNNKSIYVCISLFLKHVEKDQGQFLGGFL